MGTARFVQPMRGGVTSDDIEKLLEEMDMLEGSLPPGAEPVAVFIDPFGRPREPRERDGRGEALPSASATLASRPARAGSGRGSLS